MKIFDFGGSGLALMHESHDVSAPQVSSTVAIAYTPFEKIQNDEVIYELVSIEAPAVTTIRSRQMQKFLPNVRNRWWFENFQTVCVRIYNWLLNDYKIESFNRIESNHSIE